MRSISPRLVVVTWLGLGLTGAWVAGVVTLLGMGNETSVPLLLAPLLVVISLPALARQARREGSDALFWLLIAALVLKLAGAVAREYVAFQVYQGATDVIKYHEAGVSLSQAFRAGNFETGLSTFTSTNFIRLLTGVVYTIIGPNRLGGFLVFSWLGFWGMFFFYRAYTVAVPQGRSRTYARLVFFLPSLLFWSSSIGKEAWMMFALGIVAYGAALLLSGATPRGLTAAVLGLWLAALVRPHIAGMAALAIGAGYLLRRQRTELRQLAPLAKVVGLGLIALVAVFLIVRTDRFLGESGIDTTAGVTSVFTQVEARTDSGGSEFAPTPILESPLRAPIGIGTVLFRPFIFEVDNAQGIVAAAEGTFLMLLLLVRFRWAIAAVRSMRRQPYVAFAVAFVAMFVVAFSGVANFGLLARQRVQFLPLYLVLFSIPHRKEEDMAPEQDERPTSWAAGRIRQATFRTTRRGYDPEQVDQQLSRVADHVQALEAKVNELEKALRETRAAGDAGQPTTSKDPYESTAGRVTELVRSFDKEVQRLRREAEEERNRALAEARAEAERMRHEAQAKADEARATADRILKEARAEADRALSNLGSRRDGIVRELGTLRARIATALEDLDKALEVGTRDRVLLLRGDEAHQQQEGKEGPRSGLHGAAPASRSPETDTPS